ncbi:hypothetical protein [Microbacterium sp. JZ31]|uniref:hypothetical protein n=1 Tax=Microbacterium sp. JZ31 TaxID=1906274 RepID=UPI00193186B3|nr:hypothetical protein [Microbacterium sp. JZ31]
MTSPQPARPELFAQSDRWSFILLVPLSAIIAVVIVMETAQRLAAVIPNADIPIELPLAPDAAALDLTAEGVAVTAWSDRATVLLSDVPGGVHAALIAAPLIHGAAMLVALATAALFTLNLARGIAFDVRNTRLIAISGAALALDLAARFPVDLIVTNHARAALDQDVFGGTATDSGFFLSLFLVFVISAVAVAFAAGARLQKDTEGLV